MSYPTSTFQRSDSQSGLYARTRQQQSSASQGQPRQQNQQNPQHPSSRPRFESRSSSDLTTTPSALSGFYADDSEYDWEGQALESAKESIGKIRAKIRSIGESQDVDIDGTIALFEQIKKAQTQRDLSLVRENDSALIETLSDPLYKLIKKLNSDLQSDKKLVASFNAEDIHVLFNGLSAIVGESVSDSLLSKQHFNKLRQPLRQITETLLVHALDQGLMQKHWDSSSLINACNWISRGLKNTILSAKSAVLKKGFTQALLMMNGRDLEQSIPQAAATAVNGGQGDGPAVAASLRHLALGTLNREPTEQEERVFRNRYRTLARTMTAQDAMKTAAEDMLRTYLNSSEFVSVH